MRESKSEDSRGVIVGGFGFRLDGQRSRLSALCARSNRLRRGAAAIDVRPVLALQLPGPGP